MDINSILLSHNLFTRFIKPLVSEEKTKKEELKVLPLPQNIKNLNVEKISNNIIKLKWDKPEDENFSYVKILRKIGSSSNGLSDGKIISINNDIYCIDAENFNDEENIFYNVYSFNQQNKFNTEPVSINIKYVKDKDVIQPQHVETSDSHVQTDHLEEKVKAIECTPLAKGESIQIDQYGSLNLTLFNPDRDEETHNARVYLTKDLSNLKDLDSLEKCEKKIDITSVTCNGSLAMSIYPDISKLKKIGEFGESIYFALCFLDEHSSKPTEIVRIIKTTINKE